MIPFVKAKFSVNYNCQKKKKDVMRVKHRSTIVTCRISILKWQKTISPRKNDLRVTGLNIDCKPVYSGTIEWSSDPSEDVLFSFVLFLSCVATSGNFWKPSVNTTTWISPSHYPANPPSIAKLILPSANFIYVLFPLYYLRFSHLFCFSD